MPLLRLSKSRRAVRTGLLLALTLVTAGCDSVERADDGPKPIRARPGFQIEVPRIMRGTIAQEAIMLGYQPVVVRGYGLVVGLDDTGSATMPPDVRAHMLQEMRRRGVGSHQSNMGHLSPEQMLNSLQTTVVIVEGVIPPGAVGRKRGLNGRLVDGTSFDLRIRIDPRSEATSLEGGRLYTCDLRPVSAGEVFPPTGGAQARPLAVGRGPIFVNPFAEPGSDRIDTSIGRILDGGLVTEDMPLKLRLATPSHARAEILQAAIRTRFPREPGMMDEVAHGENDASIRITVPPSYHQDPQEFVTLLRHMSIRTSRAEAIANTVRRTVTTDPIFAEEAAWRWRALGQRALPVIRDLYDDPNEIPRLAALRAGSHLGDALTIRPLLDMAINGEPKSRLAAIRLLQNAPFDPRIESELATLLDDGDVDVRLAAYETIRTRGGSQIRQYDVDGNFILDIVESSHPMIYISQTGQPRIALFGRDEQIKTPAYASIWEGRLITKDAPNEDEVEVFFRSERAFDASVIQLAPRDLAGFIRFLGHRVSVDAPMPGVGLTYANTIGAVYQLHKEGIIDVQFRSDRDRVQAALLRMRERSEAGPRPEFAEDEAAALEASDPDFANIRGLGFDTPAMNPDNEPDDDEPSFDTHAAPALDPDDG